MWVDDVTAAGFVVASTAAIMAYLQLRDGKNIARGRFILEIDRSLAPFEKIRRQINQGKPVPDKIELRRYIAAIERIGLLLRKGYLEMDTVERCYGSRLANLIGKRDGEHIRIVAAKPSKWEDFVWLWRAMSAPLNLPDAPVIEKVEKIEERELELDDPPDETAQISKSAG
jgi:hypothetical protein